MAKYNLMYARYCKITESENESTGVVTETLGTGAVFAKAIKASVSVKTSEAKLYADGGLAESVKEFVSGSISFDGDDISDAVLADISGASVDETTSDLTSAGSDSAPYVRFGFIVGRMVGHVQKFTAVCYMKVCFALPGDEAETKGETISLKGESVSGDIMLNSAGVWRKRKTFDTLAAAKTYLNPLVGITG